MNETEHNDNSEIEYQDGQGMMTTRTNELKTSKMVSWLMKISGGLVKSTAQANYVFIGIAIALLVLAFFISPSAQPLPKSGAIPVGQMVP